MHYRVVCFLLVACNFGVAGAQPPDRVPRNQEFHARAQQRTGIIVPMYVYPANVHQNIEYNRLLDIKRRHETVPTWVIVNPSSGPGERVDPNYTKAIDRLQG